MNTFDIDPSSPSQLAADAAKEVAKFDPDTLIAVRGINMYQSGTYDDGSEWEEVQSVLYTVSACPDQEDQTGYNWSYVRAGDWLDEFNSVRSVA